MTNTFVETYRGYEIWYHEPDIGSAFYYVLGYTNHFNSVTEARMFIDSLPHSDYLVMTYCGPYEIWFHETSPNFGYWYVKGYPNQFASVENAMSFIDTLPHPDLLVTTYKNYGIWVHWITCTNTYFYVEGYTDQFYNLLQARNFIDVLTQTPPEDILVETYKNYGIWYHEISPNNGFWFYVKGYSNQFASIVDARGFIDTLQPPPDYWWLIVTISAVAFGGVGFYLYRRRRHKK